MISFGLWISHSVAMVVGFLIAALLIRSSRVEDNGAQEDDEARYLRSFVYQELERRQ